MLKTKIIGVVAGGFSGEAEVSLKSAAMIMQFIDRNKFTPYLMVISDDGWAAQLDEGLVEVDKSDFSIPAKDGKITLDGCFIIIHGDPGENGVLQGYLDLIGLPYTTGNVFNMSLTSNKVATNNLLRQYGLNTAKNILLRPNDHYSSSEIVMELGMPIFVKPNQGGSSIAISKVKAKEGLHRAINLAFSVSDEVILEKFIEGKEVTCGVINIEGEVVPLPLTEIVSHREFFDYEAKYSGKTEEITPANIGDGTSKAIQELAARIYKQLNCQGMIRVDFIIQNGVPHIIEVNTVPGFSKESIIPQQAAVAGISKTTLITHVIESCF